MAEGTVSRWDDYLDVFVSPTRLFERRSDGQWGHPFLVCVVLFVLLFFASKSAMQPIFDAEMARGMAAAAKANPQLTADQIEKMKGVGSIGLTIFAIVGVPIILFAVGLFTWLATRIVGGAMSYAQGLTIAALAYFPKLIDFIAGAVQALMMDESKLNGRLAVSLGPARFFDPNTTNPVLLMPFLGRLDLFTLWTTILIGLGIKVVGKRSTAQAVAGATIVWLLGALVPLWQASRL